MFCYSQIIFFIHGFFMINSVSLPHRQVLMVGKNHCQLTAIDIENKTEKYYPSIANNSVCYFDFVSGREKPKLYVNHLPGYFSEFSFVNKSLFPEDIQLESLIDIPTNGETKLTDFNYYYSFQVDSVHEKLYGVTTKPNIESEKLFVFDIMTKDYAIILSNLESPNHLCLDPTKGLIFISQSTSILKVNMDGTSAIKIVNETGISNLAVDYKSERIYWVKFKYIHSSNYDGDDSFIVHEDTKLVLSLTVLDSKIFWATSPHKVNPNSVIWACDVSGNKNCIREKFASIDTRSGYEKILLKAYDLDNAESIESNKQDCTSCEQLCFTSNTCACKLGYGFDSESKFCEPVDDYLLYVENDFVKGKRLDQSSITEPFSDVLEPIILSTEADVRSFDYDYTENLIYFIDGVPNNNTLYSKDLQVDSQQFKLDTYNNSTILHEKVTSVSYDWMSMNIYILYELVNEDGSKPSKNRQSKVGIRVQRSSKLEKTHKYKRRLLEIYSGSRQLGSGAIVVHPNYGRIYFTTVDSNYSGLCKANSDGGNFEFFYNSPNLTITNLAIDFTKDKLYLLTKSNCDEYEIMRMSPHMKASEEKIFKIPMKNPISVSFHKDVAFIATTTSIWRMNKTTGGNLTMIVGSPEFPKVISGAKVYSQEAQRLIVGHACSFNNAGCQKFCFSGYGSTDYQCGCEETEMLQADGKRCLKTYPKNVKIFEHEVF